MRACRLLCDPVAVEDVVQDAFVAVWSKAAFYRGEQGSASTWLWAIIRHRMIDRVCMVQHRREQALLLSEEEMREEYRSPDVWEEAWYRERNKLRVALDRLPDEQRRAIEAVYFDGYTHVELAERCGLPLGTVKGRILLGLRKLKDFLEGAGLQEW